MNRCITTKDLLIGSLASIVLGAILTAGFGCGARLAHVTNLPANTTEQQAKNYDAEVAALHKIALTTSTLRQTVIDLRNAGAFEDTAYGTTLIALTKIDQAQMAASAYLRDAPEYFADPQKQRIAEIFSGITMQLQHLNNAGVTGIKNPDSLKQVNNLITELTGVVNLVLGLTQ